VAFSFSASENLFLALWCLIGSAAAIGKRELPLPTRKNGERLRFPITFQTIYLILAPGILRRCPDILWANPAGFSFLILPESVVFLRVLEV
jgi:hypothetical protein